MLVPFDELASDARIWIYQSDRKITHEEKDELEVHLKNFISAWTAHGNNLQGSYKIEYDQFIIIGVDESFNQASGCSIDSLFHFIQSIENQTRLILNDRSKVAFLVDDHVLLEDFRNTRKLVENNTIAANTPTFNNHITTKKALDENWLSAVEDSWLKKYL